MQGFLELRIDEEANCHPGKSLESGNSGASSWRVGRIDPTSQSNRFDQHECGQWSIEEELRLPVSMVPTSIHFCHHKAAKCRLGIVSWRCLDLNKVVCMKLTTHFWQFHLEWVSFFCHSWKNWSLMIGRSWNGCGNVCRWVPLMECVISWFRR